VTLTSPPIANTGALEGTVTNVNGSSAPATQVATAITCPPQRIAVGHGQSSTPVNSYVLSSVTVQDGLLVVNVATTYDTGGTPPSTSPSSVTYNGIPMNLAKAVGMGANGTLQQYYLAVSSGTANVAITLPGGVNNTIAVTASNLIHLANNTLDQTASAGIFPPPNSGTTGTTATANEIAVAAFVLFGTTGYTFTWLGTPVFLAGGQDEGMSFGATGTVTLTEGYYVASATGTFNATLTITSGSLINSSGLVCTYQ
jgi:hypothetical protein